MSLTVLDRCDCVAHFILGTFPIGLYEVTQLILNAVAQGNKVGLLVNVPLGGNAAQHAHAGVPEITGLHPVGIFLYTVADEGVNPYGYTWERCRKLQNLCCYEGSCSL